MRMLNKTKVLLSLAMDIYRLYFRCTFSTKLLAFQQNHRISRTVLRSFIASKLEYFNHGDIQQNKTSNEFVTIKQNKTSEHAADFLTDFFANTARPTGFKLDRNGNAIIVA